MEKELEAAMEAVYQGKAFGSTAAKLLANGMNANALRTCDTLRKDEWKLLDETVVEISKQRLVGAADLISRGLVYNISNGLGTTVLEFETESDFNDAEMNMDGVARGNNDRPNYEIGYLPLPIIHKDYQISARVLESSRRIGRPLDTTSAAIAARKVSEKIETVLFTGASSYTFGGGVIRGYTDHASRVTGNLADAWDETNADPVADIIAMKAALIAKKHYGPYMVYIPTNFETVLDEDYNATYPSRTIKERLRQIDNVIDVKVADKLTADKVVMVEMSPETIRMVIGMQPTNVEWQIEGGLLFHYKVMAIMVPQIRADQDGNCGVAHYSSPS